MQENLKQLIDKDKNGEINKSELIQARKDLGTAFTKLKAFYQTAKSKGNQKGHMKKGV